VLFRSCTSKTTKLPAYKVAQHASALFGTFKARVENNSQPIIILNPIDENGAPLGTKVIEVEPCIVFGPSNTTSNWRVLISRAVLNKIHQQRKDKSPVETGGYLYGGMDEALSEIYVIAASDEPPGTMGTETSLELGQAGNTRLERNLSKHSQGRIQAIGSWHSHPSGSPCASAKDFKTTKHFYEKDRVLGFPTLMFITGVSKNEAYVLAD